MLLCLDIVNNLLVGVANPTGNIAGRVKELGRVENNVAHPAGTDIGFVNAEGMNFAVKEDSIIKQVMGDDHFDASKAGLYRDEYRTELGVEMTAPVLTAPADKAEDVSVASGVAFSWQPVEGAGSYRVEVASDETFGALWPPPRCRAAAGCAPSWKRTPIISGG